MGAIFRVHGILPKLILMAWGGGPTSIRGYSPRRKTLMGHQSGSDVPKIFRCLQYILFFFPTPSQLRAPGFTPGEICLPEEAQSAEEKGMRNERTTVFSRSFEGDTDSVRKDGSAIEGRGAGAAVLF